MRHYMEDPDNENRLLKVPPRVVEGIKAEALDEAVKRVEALDVCTCDVDWDTGEHQDWCIKPMSIAAIKGEQ